MTHILVLYDGQVGDYNNFEMFIKWINSLSYKVELPNGVTRQYTVEPRIMVPINLRVCDKAKDQLVADLIGLENKKAESIIHKIPKMLKNFFGISTIDESKINAKSRTHRYKTVNLEGYPKGVPFGYVTLIGEFPDDVNEYGEENL